MQSDECNQIMVQDTLELGIYGAVWGIALRIVVGVWAYLAVLWNRTVKHSKEVARSEVISMRNVARNHWVGEMHVVVVLGAIGIVAEGVVGSDSVVGMVVVVVVGTDVVVVVVAVVVVVVVVVGIRQEVDSSSVVVAVVVVVVVAVGVARKRWLQPRLRDPKAMMNRHAWALEPEPPTMTTAVENKMFLASQYCSTENQPSAKRSV
jgi:hypothetical protein